MLERPRWEVQRQVEALTDRAILERLANAETSTYSFHHARQAEVLYRNFTAQECQSLHARIAEDLKASSAGADPKQHAELALHLLRASSIREAFQIGVKAIEGFMQQHAHREAFGLAESLALHLDRMSEERAHFLNLMGECLMRQRQLPKARGIFQKALEEARERGEEREAAVSLMGLSWACFWDQDPRVTERGMLAARQAYVILCRLRDIPLTVTLLCKWAGYFLGAKKLKVAERMIEKARSLEQEDRREAEWTHILPDKAILLALRGHYKEARELMERALRMAEAERDVFSVILNLVNLSYLAHICGDYRLALSYLSRQEMSSSRETESLASAHIDLLRGINLLGRARLAEAATTLQELNRRSDSTLQLYVRVSLKLSLIDALVYLGRAQEAQALIAEVEAAGAHELSVEQEVLRQIAKVRFAKATGNIQEVRRSVELAIADARERGNRRFEAKAIQELLLLDRPGWTHAESAGMEERVLEIASDGESVEEAIVASVVRARRAVRSHLPGEARAFLDEAYALAEAHEARIWSMRVLREQAALAAAMGDGTYASAIEALRKERIQEILGSIDDEAHKEAFRRSELTEGWEETQSRLLGAEGRAETGPAGVGSSGMRVWTPRSGSSPQVSDPIKGQDDALIVGRSAELKRVLSKVAIAAKGDLSVLVQGESGTGKELVARRIHQLSSRARKPFVAADCGAIPESLIESELFGYRRGAFTGADRDKPGLFEEVNGGTLLLDEIGNAGANFQAKLLRVLQEREVRRIGENRTRPVDVRIVAATNLNLRNAVEQGSFREDLFYRLSVITIEVPPLRDRKDDIPILTRAFLLDMQKQGQKVGSLSSDGLEVMTAYSWPGNVRELRNALQAAVLAADGAPVGRTHLPEAVQLQERIGKPQPSVSRAKAPAADDSEKRRLEEALLATGGDKSAACKLLGWNRMKLYRRIRQYKLPLDIGKPPHT
jgi:DNA-binding NtrC family response regulator/tetratricopeptide (TPR) repeat protein